MKKTILVGAVVAFAMTGSAFAAESKLGYNYGEINYLNTKLDDDGTFGIDVDGDGFGLQGAMALNSNVHAFVEFQTQDFDFDIGVDTWELGVGVNWPLADNVDLIGRAAYAKGEADFDGDEVFSENGYALQAGVRALVGEQVELEGLAHHTDLGEDLDGTTFRLTGRYNFTEMFSGTLGAELDSDATTWMVGFRVNFPR
jgi:hypothetical protein